MTPTTLVPGVDAAPSPVRRTASVGSGHSVTLVGIVLAGSYQGAESTFAGLMPRPLVPIAQAPLLSYSLRWLAAQRVAAARLCLNGDARPLDSWLSTARPRFDLPLEVVEDRSPRGPAGSARDAALSTDAETFVVVEATVIPVVNLDAVVAEHERRGAALTAVVQEAAGGAAAARVATPAGIYVFARRAFEAVATGGFQDIKEHLVPALRRRGERIAAFAAPDFSPRVLNAETYLAVNHWVIAQLPAGDQQPAAGDVFCRHGEVVAHPTAAVHPTARVIGPVVLGAGSSIGADATIVGPSSIGAHTRVDDGAVVCRSVLWSDCRIGAGAFVDHAVVADGVRIAARSAVRRAVKRRAADGWRLGAAGRAKAPRLERAPAGSLADPVAP